MNEECPMDDCDGEMIDERFKDALAIDWMYLTVYLRRCNKCLYIDPDKTWVE